MTQSQEALYRLGLNHLSFSATHTLTATSSFSNVPLKQIWSRLSIILLGTTCVMSATGQYQSRARSQCVTGVRVTPAISVMVSSVISLSTLRRAPLWRKVMAFRRSPSDTLTNADILWTNANTKKMLHSCRGLPLKPPQQFQNKALRLIDPPQLILLLPS